SDSPTSLLLSSSVLRLTRATVFEPLPYPPASYLFSTMVNVSNLFLAVLAAAATSTSALPLFNVDTPCLGFGYLFGGPHHGPNTPDTMMAPAPTPAA
ncbi:hypothetical protein C8F04DRAFT_1130547, partial [Mycena alexandri]